MTVPGCVTREMDSCQECKEFCELNSHKNFDGLYDVSIGVRRVSAEYDDSLNQNHLIFNSIEVFDVNSKKDVTIPVFKRGASLTEQDSIFNRIKPGVKEFLEQKLGYPADSILFESYVQYINDIYQKYYSIEVPADNNYKNIILESHPRTGKFITFVLNDRAKVYYVADSATLNEYWSKRFSTLTKLRKGWYCEISKGK
jgi:hypothetical protein